MAMALDPNDPFFAALKVVPPTPRSHSKIVRGGSAKAIFDAERKVADAERQSAQMLDDIAQTITQARAAGFDDGRREADRILAAEMNRVERQTQEFYESAEVTIADIAVKIATRIIGEHTSDLVLSRTVRQAVDEHTQDAPYCIQVAADTRVTAEEAIAQLRIEHPDMTLPSVRVDARLPSGRAILVTRFGTVDLDIESQLRAIHDSLTAGKVQKKSGSATR